MKKKAKRLQSNLVTLFMIIFILSLPLYFCAKQKLSKSQLLEDLDSYIKKATEEERFSGVVLLAKNGKPFFKKPYGLASKSYMVPNHIDTKFNLGSMNKMFTAVAIAQLVEKGKLSYDDSIGKDLGRDWVSDEAAKKAKIYHILTHTAGFGSFFNSIFWNTPRDQVGYVDDYKALIAGDTLKFEPGKGWSYSNSGFILLGALIEKVTGESYFDYVRENIYDVADMVNTGEYEMDTPVPNLAIGYGKIEGPDGKERWENNLFKHHIKGSPSGGGFSTAEDLLDFDIALRTHKLVSQESWDLLTTPQPNTGTESLKWGYGFVIQENEKLGRIVGHGGGFFGINSTLDMYLDSGYTVVVMSNYTDGLQAVADRIVDVLIALEQEKGK